MAQPTEAPAPGRPVVFRNGLVLTMDDTHTVLPEADVLVVDHRSATVGTSLDVPDGSHEIDASGIVMPGMIDTHRHMWQTAMRGYGADWILTQYFVWYYLEHGNKFRPEDVFAGNQLCGWEALEAEVTTTVDGRVVKYDHALVGADLAAVRRTVDATVEHLRGALGEQAWAQGMNPELPADDEVLDNPYQCTEYKSESTHAARGSVFGDAPTSS
jgi:cytosine/adenosine deaminase-related metal-dependent hydrolase